MHMLAQTFANVTNFEFIFDEEWLDILRLLNLIFDFVNSNKNKDFYRNIIQPKKQIQVTQRLKYQTFLY